ncbi:hypothetical protein PMG11_01144 [Penicillium brasilianum]|uniref:Uncharacterized protein n=1 Tax=Penicillium brasilianum TaxID=104259 RepID=A0A0F7TE98_PENBI|nr:hypothetical protein PMG11_01144 [Penicillium brasilianum]
MTSVSIKPSGPAFADTLSFPTQAAPHSQNSIAPCNTTTATQRAQLKRFEFSKEDTEMSDRSWSNNAHIPRKVELPISSVRSLRTSSRRSVICVRFHRQPQGQR